MGGLFKLLVMFLLLLGAQWLLDVSLRLLWKQAVEEAAAADPDAGEVVARQATDGAGERAGLAPNGEKGAGFAEAGVWPVVGSSPGPRAVTQRMHGAATPSVHLGVPESLSVTPGRGKGLRQQLGWKKVLGTADSGIWVLKGESRGYALPSNLGVAWWRSARIARPGSRQRTGVSVLTSMDVQLSGHNQIAPFGMELWDCGAGSRPF